LSKVFLNSEHRITQRGCIWWRHKDPNRRRCPQTPGNPGSK
jgi:hypothetical protein